MVDNASMPSQSPLLDEALQGQLKQILAKIKEPVDIRAVVDMEDKNSQEMAAFLRAFCSLSGYLRLELYDV